MTRTTLIALILGVATPVFAGPAEDKGLKIAIKSDKANEGFVGERSVMKMILINAHGDRVERSMSSETCEGDNDGDKSKIEFISPADVQGTRMLTHTHKTGDDDQWLYLPAIERVKRISSRNKSGSFMGSEFAYEDLGSQEVEKYTYKFLREETVDGRKTWVSERYPTDKRSGYTKQVTWTDQEYMNPLKIEYYDRKNELLKTGIFKDYKKHGKFWRVGTIDMFNHQTKKRSVLEWPKRKLGEEVDEDDFDADELAG